MILQGLCLKSAQIALTVLAVLIVLTALTAIPNKGWLNCEQSFPRLGSGRVMTSLPAGLNFVFFVNDNSLTLTSRNVLLYKSHPLNLHFHLIAKLTKLHVCPLCNTSALVPNPLSHKMINTITCFAV